MAKLKAILNNVQKNININKNTNNQTSNFAEYINKKYIRFQSKIEDVKFTKTRKPTLMDYLMTNPLSKSD